MSAAYNAGGVAMRFASRRQRGNGMATRSVGLGEMFGWFGDTFQLVGRTPGAMFGAGALTVAAMFVATIPMLLVMVFGLAGMGGMMATMSQGDRIDPSMLAPAMPWLLGGMAVMMLLLLLLLPPLLIGWNRMVRTIDAGQPARALDIFAPYREGAAWGRGIGYAVACGVAMLLLVAVFVALAWGPIQQFAAFEAVLHPGARLPAEALGAPPVALVLAYFGFLFLAMLLQVGLIAGFGEVSLRTTPVLSALGLGVGAALRNVLPLIAFGVVFFVLMLLAMLGLWVVMFILLLVTSLVLPLIGPMLVQVGFNALLYPVVFTGYYVVWRSLLGDRPAVTP